MLSYEGYGVFVLLFCRKHLFDFVLGSECGGNLGFASSSVIFLIYAIDKMLWRAIGFYCIPL